MPRRQNALFLRIHCSQGLCGCGRERCRHRHCSSHRKRDRAITFLLPSCFLALSGFRFNPLGGPLQPHLIGAAAPLSRGWGRAAPPLGSPSESLIEGGVASTIPLKQNHIPALIVSTPGFGWYLAAAAVESLALPDRPFPPSSPPRHRGETVALFAVKKTCSLALGCAGGRCISEGRRG